MPDGRSDRYCVIGAGASGLATAKNFRERGIPFDCLEREGDLGGLWNIATNSGIVYETAHLISSISSTGYDDLPMLDEDYPEYPSHTRVLGYFRDYAARFGLAEHIEFGKTVERIDPCSDGSWSVSVAGEERRRIYRGVVIATGHHDVPRLPTYPGNFAGEMIHSRCYKSPRQVRDKRVLVVGCGNSAADIVSDAVHGGSKVFLSIRRGYWFVPKFLLGFPTGDVISYLEMMPLPRRAKRWLFQASLWLLQGPPSRYRMPDPDYAIDQAHPTMTDEIPRLVVHGDLTIKPEIASYHGSHVTFRDGTGEAIDMIVFATGYQTSIAFIDAGIAFTSDGGPRFAANVFHEEHPRLFAVGLTQANGSMWRLADYQSQLIATMIVAEQRAPERARQFRVDLKEGKLQLRTGDFIASDRHRLEVNYYDYRRLLKRLGRRFGPARGMPWVPPASALPGPAARAEPSVEAASWSRRIDVATDVGAPHTSAIRREHVR